MSSFFEGQDFVNYYAINNAESIRIRASEIEEKSYQNMFVQLQHFSIVMTYSLSCIQSNTREDTH
jgi:hypothetical protein